LNKEGAEDRFFQASPLEITNLYPNPASDVIRVATNLLSDSDLNVNIYNQLGKLVKTQTLGIQLAGEQAIDIEVGNLPQGSYSMTIRADRSVETKKFQIIR
jgi:flagellar hook assembly protein FlgD